MYYPMFFYASPVSNQVGYAREQTPKTPFMDHLTTQIGNVIFVATPIGVIKGTLEAIFSDSILVKSNAAPYHIRLEQIIYFTY
ncbi:DUF2642 domain-containing protein [Aneurinibacillus sp. Ricciae_BoGa-3]|uniref:DUF2642 domain-containing protein n=1 Tax=Aneurinibacillus sp. Ricciae_BoGa-3 TaxID=3022697 RepID=UPI0023404ECB|nr:DUF2642 domain-containing protein [Aneurinibacillus sp. Ricciae_BoGa-3]WCK53303.1 DUF2642 domain-containing protein [Aneurinibacillus sp. Ricciae_BoGa-3]